MCLRCPAQRSLLVMRRNPPSLIARVGLLLVVIAFIREMSIRRNSEAMSDWPRHTEVS